MRTPQSAKIKKILKNESDARRLLKFIIEKKNNGRKGDITEIELNDNQKITVKELGQDTLK